ncbi:hypothetical protein DPMN_063044 [Dreissena polymorpha]|uniref:Uncharacterized protein n=1 Tax=Dreissena polymorpha TaxID=45954 RepID=A0A9D4CAS9_DREPO|nr:hypothetical protein DPMN_063044 [Dreissena polymorpha]
MIACIQTSALNDAERKFRKACVQITLLNKKLNDVQKRYHNACAENLRSFRYNLRLKMSCVESVRDTYYDYAYAQAEVVADLRRKLYGEVVNIVTDDDDEIDDVIDAIDDVYDENTGANNVETDPITS